MLKQCVVVLSLCLLGAWAASAEKVATVSSSEAFQLRGVTVPVSGVPSWPVAVGDDIVAGTSPVTVSFSDGSRVVLAAQSKAKIEKLDNRVTLRLMGGSGEYSVASSPGIRLAVGQRAVPVGPGTRGSISVDDSSAARRNESGLQRGRDGDDDDQGLPPVSKYKKPKKPKKNR